MTNRDEAREAARGRLNSDGTATSEELWGFDRGFDAGYDFAKSEDRWHVIERDGMPNDVEKWYFVAYEDDGMQSVPAELYLFRGGKKSVFTTIFGFPLDETQTIAWRPLPEPYKEDEDAVIEAEARADWEAIEREQSTNR